MKYSKNKITLLNIASTIILQGLAFFSGPIFSSLLGTSNYGVASVYMTGVQLFTTVFSLQAASTIAIARVNYPLEEQPRYQSSVLSLATISYCFFSFLFMAVSFMVPIPIFQNRIMMLVGLLHGWGMYCVQVFNSKFTYEFKAGKNFILSVVIAGSTVVGSVLLIQLFPSEENYWGRILGQSIVYTGAGLVLFTWRLITGKTIFNRQYWEFTLKISIPTIFHLLASIVLGQSDRVMLQNIAGNAQAGIYALAATFGTVINTIWGALNNSWVPFYYEYTKNEEQAEIRSETQRYVELFTVLTCGFILLAKEVFQLYANVAFWEGTDLIPLFAIGYYFVFLYSFPVNFEFYHKKTKMVAVGTSLAAICNILLNVVLIHLWGILGAVIATAFAHGLQFLFHYIYARKIREGAFPFHLSQFIPGILIVFLTTGIYMATKELSIIRWSLAAIIGLYEGIKILKRKTIF